MSRPGSVPLFALGIIALLIATVVVMGGRTRLVRGTLMDTTPGAEEQSPTPAEAATSERASSEEILTKVRTHIAVPENPPPTVMAILDIALLRKKNAAFYVQAENGDYLILTQNRAILYDPEGDRLLDVVPIKTTKDEG